MAVMRWMSVFLAAAALSPAAANSDPGAARWKAGQYEAAVAAWRKPAEQGDPAALFGTGQALLLGKGTPQNKSLAHDYFRTAASKGHKGAAASLGISLWQDGKRTEALQYLRTAADQGEPRAAYVLGVATFNGEGVPRNQALGFAYIAYARDAGLPIAKNQAGLFATRMTPEQRARAEAASASIASGQPVAVALAAPVAPAAKPATPTPAPAATAAATQAPEPEAKEAKAAEPEGFRVQLGAYTSERAARSAWTSLVAQQAALLKGQKPLYSTKAGLVRLQVGGFAERNSARALCQELSAAGRPCFVTQN